MSALLKGQTNRNQRLTPRNITADFWLLPENFKLLLDSLPGNTAEPEPAHSVSEQATLFASLDEVTQ